MTREEFIDMLMLEFNKNQEIKSLNDLRVAEEKSLIEEYKVDECNNKRNAIQIKYAELIKAVRNR